MECPKCGSRKFTERLVSIGRSDREGTHIQSHQHSYECDSCWWTWEKEEISQETTKLIRDAQEEAEQRRKIWDQIERTGLFDELRKQWEGKGKEDRPCPPVYPFGPGRANPSPYAFPRQWNDGGTTGTPPDQWYVRW